LHQLDAANLNGPDKMTKTSGKLTKRVATLPRKNQLVAHRVETNFYILDREGGHIAKHARTGRKKMEGSKPHPVGIRAGKSRKRNMGCHSHK